MDRADCSYLRDTLPDVDGCAPATDLYYECLSQLDCQTLETLEGFPCRDEYQAAFRRTSFSRTSLKWLAEEPLPQT